MIFRSTCTIIPPLVRKTPTKQERDPGCPFGLTARLAKINELRFRTWLDDSLIHLDADKQRGGPSKHRRFSELDVIRIAIVSRLVPYGFTVKEASDLVERIFKDIKADDPKLAPFIDHSEYLRKHPEHRAAFENISPEDKLRDRLQVVRLTVGARDEKGGGYFIEDMRKPETKRTFDIRLVLNVGTIVQDLFWDLEEFAHEKFQGEKVKAKKEKL